MHPAWAGDLFHLDNILVSMLFSQNTPPSPSPTESKSLRAGALGRPRGMRWRGRREWGLGWGTHVNPWLIHVNIWQNPLQYCKVISLQLIKINGKKNKQLKPKNKNKNQVELS